MRRLFYATLLVIGWLGIVSTPVQAETLRIQPLEYRTTLATGDIQKGFVDITNPSQKTVTVTISVRAFRQIDSQGTLQFYDSEAMTAGVLPDLTEFELKRGETIRLFFLVDGNKLPSGDVFAALFATAKADANGKGVERSVRVGTLLSIVNGTPGSRQAVVTNVSVPFWQFGDQLQGEYTIKNTADPNAATGFYPEPVLAVNPLHAQYQLPSKLVYAGIARNSEFAVNESRLGLYKVAVNYDGSSQSQWVFMATGSWRWIGLILLIVGLVAIVLGMRWYHRRRKVRFKH